MTQTIFILVVVLLAMMIFNTGKDIFFWARYTLRKNKQMKMYEDQMNSVMPSLNRMTNAIMDPMKVVHRQKFALRYATNIVAELRKASIDLEITRQVGEIQTEMEEAVHKTEREDMSSVCMFDVNGYYDTEKKLTDFIATNKKQKDLFKAAFKQTVEADEDEHDCPNCKNVCYSGLEV